MTFFFLAGIFLLTLAALMLVIVPLVKRKSYWMTLFIAIAFPIVSLALYFYWGSSQQLFHYWALQKESARVQLAMAKIKSPEEVVNQLKEHLRQHPDSPHGWYLLGRLYFSLNHYGEAVGALKKAYELDSNKTEYATTYAEALFFNNGKHLTSNVTELLQSVLRHNPLDINANNLLALNAYNNGNYRLAVQYWEKLLPLFPPGSKDSQTLLSMISRAQKELKNRE